MYPRFFTQNIDADRLILMETPDRELFSLCVPRDKNDIYSKYSIKLSDENFWRSRVNKYFSFTVQDIPENMSWKRYYISLVYYISEMKKGFTDKSGTPFTFDALKYPGIPKNQYKFFHSRERKVFFGLLIIEASAKGELGIVKYLVDNGADVDIVSGSAIQQAAGKGHIKVVQYLVEHGADIHSFLNDPLSWSSANGHLNIVQYLIEQGADIHTRNDFALYRACRNGHLSVVQYLVEQGADIHDMFDRPFRIACEKGHLAIVKYLVEKGADIYIHNSDGLRMAIYCHRYDVVNYLTSISVIENDR